MSWRRAVDPDAGAALHIGIPHPSPETVVVFSRLL